VTLVPSATITSLNLSSTNLVLNGTATSYTVSIQNVAPSLSGVVIQGWVSQGSVTHAANGTVVECGSGDGVLPNGTCTFSSEASANNGLSGSGTLVPGPATFRLELKDGSGVLLSTTTVPVTIVPNAPRISAVSLSSSTVVIGGAGAPYTATIDNPGASASGVVLQGWIVQGAVRHGAGGTSVFCGSGAGVVPTGTCPVSFSYGAANGVSGAGTLVAGAATLELDLIDGSGNTLSTVSLPVTLTNQ
jgi:hypothetical protein